MRGLALALLGVLAGCAPTARMEAMPEVFPHVRMDRASRTVEIDGEVPIDAHSGATPRVYLELLVCTPDTREHETVVVTPALAAHVHAALLALGLEPGRPGSWTWDGTRLVTHPPLGPALDVTIAYRDPSGREHEAPLAECAISTATGRSAGEMIASGEAGFVFAGSRLVPFEGKEYYDAQGTGTLVGLTTFGSETVAFTTVYSPEASLQEPEWIANRAAVPERGTPVVVRLRAR